MLTVLGGLAEFERELIRARTDDGRKRAMSRGRPVRTQTDADDPSNPRGPRTPRGRRAAGGDRPVLQRLALHHFEAVAFALAPGACAWVYEDIREEEAQQ
jgi:hypothetical protein